MGVIGKIFKMLSCFLFLIGAVVGCQILRNSGDAELRAKPDGALRLATYNVHYIILGKQDGPWSISDWERRRAPMDAAFKALNTDIIALQESESFTRGSDGSVNLTAEYILAQNPAYEAAGMGNPKTFPSTQPILYRTDRLVLRDQGWFFFSETPDVIYSRTFNGSYPAFASWAEFQDQQSGQMFRVLNLHTDFGSLSNRIKSAELVRDRAHAWINQGKTVIVLGDFNARLGDKVVDIVAQAGVKFANVSGSTYHLNRGLNLFGAIDHIAATPDVDMLGSAQVVRRKFLGEWPTDHYPVVLDVALGK